MAYRIVIATDSMKEHKELINLATKPNFNCYSGPGGHAVSYLLKNGTLFNMVLTAVDELPHGVYQAEGDIHEMQKRFKSWSGTFKLLLQLAKETTVWRLLNSIELEAWRHPNGNFALLGDACHATLPYLAHGAAQALEDGTVLGALFDKAETKSEIYDALEIYEKIRKPSTTQIVHGSTEFGAVIHMHDGETQRVRDLEMTQCRPFEGYPNKWADPVFQKYLFRYDADAEVAKAWSLYKAGKMAHL